MSIGTLIGGMLIVVFVLPWLNGPGRRLKRLPDLQRRFVEYVLSHGGPVPTWPPFDTLA